MMIGILLLVIWMLVAAILVGILLAFDDQHHFDAELGFFIFIACVAWPISIPLFVLVVVPAYLLGRGTYFVATKAIENKWLTRKDLSTTLVTPRERTSFDPIN